MKRILQGARNVGPYLAVEALLPGGTLIALALWFFQRRRASHVAAGETHPR